MTAPRRRAEPSAEQAAAIALLEAAGYSVLRRKSHEALTRRVAVAEARLADQIAHNEHTQAWAQRAFDETDRMRQRVDDLVEFAFRHGATIDDLAAFNDALAARRGETTASGSVQHGSGAGHGA